ncbi:NaeI family type II restriction endonuclease [Streptomyces avermitilis]
MASAEAERTHSECGPAPDDSVSSRCHSASRWELGVLEVAPEQPRANRDGKQTLSAAGREAIHWLFKDAPLPEDLLLHLDQQSLAQGPLIGGPA